MTTMFAIYLELQLLSIFTVYVPSSAIKLTNQPCQTHIHYVNIDQRFRFYPYSVKLQQCAGKDIPSNSFGCIPKTFENVTLNVLTHSGKAATVYLQNVTSCNDVCLLNESLCNEYQNFDSGSCKCNCKHTGAPSSCEPPFYWDKQRCDCGCSINVNKYHCDKRKVFNKALCRCRCKQTIVKECANRNKDTNPDTCDCFERVVVGGSQNCSDCVTKGAVGMIVVFEFILLAIIFFIWKCYCNEGNGISFWKNERSGERVRAMVVKEREMNHAALVD